MISQQDNAPELMTKKEAAAMLRVTTRTIDKWFANGSLPAKVRVIVGTRTVRFRRSILESELSPTN